MYFFACFGFLRVRRRAFFVMCRGMGLPNAELYGILVQITLRSPGDAISGRYPHAWDLMVLDARIASICFVPPIHVLGPFPWHFTVAFDMFSCVQNSCHLSLVTSELKSPPIMIWSTSSIASSTSLVRSSKRAFLGCLVSLLAARMFTCWVKVVWIPSLCVGIYTK